MIKGNLPVLVASIVIVTSLVAVVLNIPSSADYSPFNTGARGYLELTTLLDAKLVDNVDGVSEGNYENYIIILPIQRRINNDSSYQLIKNIVRNGATLIILDEQGYSNNLLRYLGINASIHNYTVLDEIVKFKDRYHPRISIMQLPSQNATLALITYKPSYMELSSKEANITLLGLTSSYAYADLNGDGYYSIGDIMGSHIVVYAQRLGRGLIVLISDLDVCTNTLMNNEENREFFRLITMGKETYLILGYLNLELIDKIKYMFSRLELTPHGQSDAMVLGKFIIIVAIVLVIFYAERRNS